MMTRIALGLIAGGLLAAGFTRAADDDAEALAKQKRNAEAVWKALEIKSPAVVVETKNLQVYSSLPEARTRSAADTAQKHFAVAAKALKYDGTEQPPWPGRLTVYLFADRGDYTSFVRQFEGRRPDPDESGAFTFRGDTPHAAAAVPKEKDGPTIESQARRQVVAALLQAKAGVGAEMPGWVREGFMRAVAYRADPQAFAAERGRMKAAAKVHKAADAWGDSDAKDTALVAAAMMDYLTFGPESSKLPAFLAAFRPGENGNPGTVAQAFEAARIDPKSLDAAWKKWLSGGK